MRVAANKRMIEFSIAATKVTLDREIHTHITWLGVWTLLHMTHKSSKTKVTTRWARSLNKDCASDKDVFHKKIVRGKEKSDTGEPRWALLET